MFGISELDCRWAFYVITACYSMGIAFFALEAFNAFELVSIKHPNAWTTTFSECVCGKSVLAARTLLTSSIVCGALLVILASMYTESTSTWSCLGTFSSVTIDLWSPILLLNVCSALIATAFSYRNLVTFKYLPHYQESVENYLGAVSLHRKNEVEKCQRDLAFTAIGPWLLVSYWQLLVISNDWVTHSLVNWYDYSFFSLVERKMILIFY
ncbi:hypothetical protein GCK32_017588 [Trichostrongylus colubriformis]|uniref:Uncharacterized protein n=1 Tax=Trichostrongylus colubriformis TaxID=6319 RepID=A0AAN8IEM9_TRICO